MTGKLLGEVLQNTNGNIVFANDNKTVFYVTNDETVRSYKVFTHVLGTPSNKDIEVYHEKDIAFSTIVSKSKSKNYIFISSYSTLSSEVRYLKTDDINGEFKLIQPRRPDLLYYPENWGDKFILRTNNNARNFKIVEVSVNSTTMDNWKDFVPYNKDVLIENFEISKNYLILQEKINGLPQLLIIDIKDKSEHNVKFDEEVYHAYLTDNRNFSSDILRFGYTSLTTPVSIFDYNMQTKDRKLLKETEILGGYNKESYETRRLFATASEGTKIPISLVYKKGIKKDGYNPLLLYGYGSYGASMSPFFSSDRVSLLDRGFIYAIAHVRGGQEMGRHWYEDGKMLKKKNTFTDFISCAEFLISEKYTEPQKLFANGVSAGGLLMGAITNMRPDLFKGIIAEVPWVDVVTDMLDETLPLTSLEWDEWGNPKNKEYYDYMLTYSPYDQVKTQKYPAILATGGLNDTQVPYWSPAKWVAKLRELKIDDNPILLKINMGAGHSGASGRFERYKLIALKYAFMLNMLSINK
jgi:oligopeptidase B